MDYPMNAPVWCSKMDKAMSDLETLEDGEQTSFNYKGEKFIFTKVTPEDEEFLEPCFLMTIERNTSRGWE